MASKQNFVSYLAFRPFWACYGVNRAVKKPFYPWHEKNKKTELSDILILTHRNVDVKELNQMIRQATDICPVVNAYKESLPLAAA